MLTVISLVMWLGDKKIPSRSQEGHGVTQAMFVSAWSASSTVVSVGDTKTKKPFPVLKNVVTQDGKQIWKQKINTIDVLKHGRRRYKVNSASMVAIAGVRGTEAGRRSWVVLKDGYIFACDSSGRRGESEGRVSNRCKSMEIETEWVWRAMSSEIWMRNECGKRWSRGMWQEAAQGWLVRCAKDLGFYLT